MTSQFEPSDHQAIDISVVLRNGERHRFEDVDAARAFAGEEVAVIEIVDRSLPGRPPRPVPPYVADWLAGGTAPSFYEAMVLETDSEIAEFSPDDTVGMLRWCVGRKLVAFSMHVELIH